MVLTYLQAYAEAHGLHRNIRFNTTVKRLYLSPSGERRWTIESQSSNNESEVSTFDYVCVSNGHYGDVWVPEIPGLK